MKQKGAVFLFESIRKKPYTDRGIRQILANYAHEEVCPDLSHPINCVIFYSLGSKNKALMTLLPNHTPATRADNRLKYIQNSLSPMLNPSKKTLLKDFLPIRL